MAVARRRVDVAGAASILSGAYPVMVTVVARNLEPCRGFHIFLRALQRIQQQHPTCPAVIVGGDGVSYGNPPSDARCWREKLLREVRLDPARTHFTGWIDRERYRSLLQVSAAHVVLTYPFVLSWSMLEAMATGCLLVVSDTAPVREFVDDGVNGWLVPFGAPVRLAERVLGALNGDGAAAAPLRQAARATVLDRCGHGAGLQGYLELMGVGTARRPPAADVAGAAQRMGTTA